MSEELEKIGLGNLFGSDFPMVAVDNPRQLVDYLTLVLEGWAPNPIAADFLKNLALKRNRPALAQGLHDSWQREQVSAIVQEFFTIGDFNDDGDDDSGVPVKEPRGPKSGGRASVQSLDDYNPSDRR